MNLTIENNQLCILKVQAAGKKAMSYNDYCLGFKFEDGTHYN